MKGISKIHKHYFKIFLIVFLFLFLSACNGVIPTSPIINSFSAIPSNIIAGESAILSWSTTDADKVSINHGIGTVALTGSTSVSPSSDTIYTLTATNSNGSNTSTVNVNINQTITIQPGPEGKDSYENPLVYYVFNPGDSELLTFGSTFLGGYRTYIQFNFNILPDYAEIVSADLKLYQFASFGERGANLAVSLHRLTQSWSENNLIYMTNQPNYLTTPESTISITIGGTGWVSWNITNLLQGWIDGNITNYGVVLKALNEGLGNNYINCHSSDYIDNPILCPKLEITYYVP